MRLSSGIVRFDGECARLVHVLEHALAIRSDNGLLYTHLVSSSVIRLHDMWAVRCRSLVLSSATGDARSIEGNRIGRSPSLRRFQTGLDFLRRSWATDYKGVPKYLGPPWEPKWHTVNDCVRASSLLKIPNESSITNALGAILCLEDLRKVRNVFAHNLPDTWGKYRMILNPSYYGSVAPADYVMQRRPGMGVLVYDWMDELRSGLIAATRY